MEDSHSRYLIRLVELAKLNMWVECSIPRELSAPWQIIFDGIGYDGAMFPCGSTKRTSDIDNG
jgi:hypothetical protein